MTDTADRELLRLANEETAREMGQGAAPGGAVPVAGGQLAAFDPAAEWKQAAHMAADLVVAVVPELRAEWTKDRLDNLGMAMHQCGQRYGWTLADVIGHPLLALAVASWPLGAGAYRVLQQREAARKAAEGDKKPENAGGGDAAAPAN